jgi:hypothetical protein
MPGKKPLRSRLPSTDHAKLFMRGCNVFTESERGCLSWRDRAEGEEMSGIRKSTDFGLTNAERKVLRDTEAREAMSDHDDAEKAFHDNRERLRTARLAREAAEKAKGK